MKEDEATLRERKDRWETGRKKIGRRSLKPLALQSSISDLRSKISIFGTMSHLSSAIFLDRDGVVNRRRVADYVKTWEEFQFLPDIFDVLPGIRRTGFLAVLITNQQGIAKGLMTEEDLSAIHRQMQEELFERTGDRFDAIYHCPHGKDDGCDCRKPRPGMLLQAAREHAIDLPSSWMIGDSESDIEAGIAAGCRTIRIAEKGSETKADMLVESLAEAWEKVEGSSKFKVQNSKGESEG